MLAAATVLIAVPLAAALSVFRTVGAQFAEGRAWSGRVLAMRSSHKVPKFRARLVVGAGTFGFAKGDMRTIEAMLGDTATWTSNSRMRLTSRHGFCYTRVALAQRRGDWAAAREVLERLESHTFAAAFPCFRPTCVQLPAETCLGAGGHEPAYRHASRALTLADEVGYASASGLALYTGARKNDDVVMFDLHESDEAARGETSAVLKGKLVEHWLATPGHCARGSSWTRQSPSQKTKPDEKRWVI